ncbi:outer membrane beta-barrel protein [Komagataeibacter rhaeticus]|nr:outer membrane beta-barrel protein [Komagataeibacter rhaeticus]
MGPVSVMVLGIGLHAGKAHAQLIQQLFPSDVPGYATDMTGSVVTRQMMGQQGDGIGLGSWLLRPTASENVGYNTNTLGIPGSGSPAVQTSANVSASSRWRRHALGASVGMDDHRYPTQSIASYTNWHGSIGVRSTWGMTRPVPLFPIINIIFPRPIWAYAAWSIPCPIRSMTGG